ncbi:MAG TPA: hypothetical protein DC047_17200 [Blastocatellia bacterium]|nr:hypothetical protein [Blastocatellia bacterium]
MKRCLAIIGLMIASLSCSPANRFNGPVSNLFPKEVGRFKLRGEVKAVDVPPPDSSGALRPTDGAYAQYESTGGDELTMQIVNYNSAADAEEALKKMRENMQNLNSAAKLSQSARSNKAGKNTGDVLILEDTRTAIDQVLWTDGSLLYVISGKGSAAPMEFESNIP